MGRGPWGFVVLALPSLVSAVGGARDTGGCLTSAGFVYCEALQRCHRPWKEACPSLEEEIRRVREVEERFEGGDYQTDFAAGAGGHLEAPDFRGAEEAPGNPAKVFSASPEDILVEV